MTKHYFAQTSRSASGKIDIWWKIKNREENKFSSRVEVWGCDSERFPKSLINRRASMPLSFLRFSFCCFLSFLSHRLLIPPFQSAFAEIREELGMTSLNDEVITRFFLSNVFRKHFQIFLRARAPRFSSERMKFFSFRRRETKLRLHFRRSPFRNQRD
jgi:hypothetical protein